MALLDILIFPDKSLREVANKVTSVDDRIQTLLENMAETMYKAPGIGLAGPQVGICERVMVVDVTPLLAEGVEGPGLLKVINPEIVEKSGVSRFEEGCLSLPGLLAEIERAACVTVKYTNEKGEEKEIKAEGILATALQHEIDHLDGVLILDYLSPIKRSRYKSKLKKEIKRMKEEGSSEKPGTMMG